MVGMMGCCCSCLLPEESDPKESELFVSLLPNLNVSMLVVGFDDPNEKAAAAALEEVAVVSNLAPKEKPPSEGGGADRAGGPKEKPPVFSS
jgi:hypothetical protein